MWGRADWRAHRSAVPSGQQSVETYRNLLQGHLGTLRDLDFERAAQPFETPSGPVMATAEVAEDHCEVRFITGAQLRPEPGCSAFEPADPLDLWAAEPGLEGRRDQGQEPLRRV